MRYDSAEVTKLRGMIATLSDEKASLRAALAEKEKALTEGNRFTIARAEKAEREAQGLRDKLESNPYCSRLEYSRVCDMLAAQAKEIKTMKDIIDSDKNAGIPIDALHVACRERDQAKKHIREIALTLDPHDSGAPDEGVAWLTKKYVKNVAESLAAKDRIISEQAAVIERARSVLASVHNHKKDLCGGTYCVALEILTVPAPQPAQEKP